MIDIQKTKKDKKEVALLFYGFIILGTFCMFLSTMNNVLWIVPMIFCYLFASMAHDRYNTQEIKLFIYELRR